MVRGDSTGPTNVMTCEKGWEPLGEDAYSHPLLLRDLL